MNSSKILKPTTYLTEVKALSDRIVKAQQPIRILDAIKWDDSIKQAFMQSACKALPAVDAGYYRQRPLGFDPGDKKDEFHQIERDLVRKLGQLNPLSVIMRRICREYQDVVYMLEGRGTSTFSNISQELYGSSQDVFHVGDPTIADLGSMMESTLQQLLDLDFLGEEPKTINAKDAVDILNAKIQEVFPGEGLRAMLSDGIVSDAAAGTDYIKIRADAVFNMRDLRILEVHEAWVHLGTTLNGLEQPYCTFLGKGPPSATVTQEGLAVLMEILTFSSTPERLMRLINRVRATTLVEEGADFLDIFEFFRAKGLDDEDSYTFTSRVFRGSSSTGMPFTKDLTYIKGFVLTYNFMRLAVYKGKPDRIPLLFCGKTMIEDMKVMADLVEEGTVSPPRFLPPQFKDLNGLSAWMSFSRFMTSLNFRQLEQDYANIL
ncbi:MAG: flavohemoglobin expression-modulating QEGLA motif protein [Methylovulum sp.]|uniref:flavohemoglobin expression-modulating QEGLA motif protein n=1 Tax=Methylovulum sp. TaxID=1916980 RepID=UPI002629B4C0|nr:flavohemoglobin expression-modulating QEGLA motif protein [Methylovulum sp.]MDD2724244.1 flavohemoglobin expression-modulating QEGLA motif protein [Methylovulum sp.]MDD5123023.1 flavohemoglobin expression-modulating QEGLA motif protein [Methylovulum sp.]